MYLVELQNIQNEVSIQQSSKGMGNENHMKIVIEGVKKDMNDQEKER